MQAITLSVFLPNSRLVRSLTPLLALAVLLAAACDRPASSTRAGPALPPPPKIESVVIQAPPGTPRPPFTFSAEDEEFLTQVQHGAFNYIWNGVSAANGMVLDRPSQPVISVAGVGFQLAGIPVGVERGWITREQGRARCVQILGTLLGAPGIRKAGLYYHFLDAQTAGQHTAKLEHIVSTVDSALLFCGAIVAGEYFGGEVKAMVDGMIAAADWAYFAGGENTDPANRGFISLGWKPVSMADPSGAGSLLPYYWLDSGCEHRLVAFLAVAADDEAKRISPDAYYNLRRGVGTAQPAGPMVYFPYSGALFVNQFSHIFINYAALGPDNPAAQGVDRRPRVDWWENSRRHTLMHRQKAIANPLGLAGLGENAWGLTASDAPAGYSVPGLYPAPVTLSGAIPGIDYPPEAGKDNYGDGTLAPYAAGCSVMFEPVLATAALRHYRELATRAPLTALWSDPATGGYGFADAFNVAKGWVAPDHLAIDHGPLLLAIENARSRLVWKLFAKSPAWQRGVGRLGLAEGVQRAPEAGPSSEK